ncbi:MAG: hypothetical protein KBG15_19805 [Kofleriaceae bacterium]|nr:hypothetical protein [Kofleriaceae bacterium]
MRIGEILLADGLVSSQDLERTLHNQARGGRDRLVSMLVAEGILDADAAARSLSKLHGVPAVLRKHFAARDPALAGLLQAELAYEYQALPIARTRDGGLVVCMMNPHQASVVAAIASVTGLVVVPAVACANVLMRMITDVYGEDTHGFDVEMNTDVHDAPVAPQGAPAAVAPELFTLALLDDDRVSRDSSQHRMKPGVGASASELMQSIHAKNTANTTGEVRAIRVEPGASVAMPSLTGIILPATNVVAPPAPAPLPLADATVAMARGVTRDAVTEICFEYITGHWLSAVLFNVKEGMALGLRGVGGNATANAVEALAFPLTSPSVLKQVADNKRAEQANGGGIINERLARIIGSDAITAVPVLVAGRLLGLLVAGPARGAASAADLLGLATALGENYARIIRSGKA